MNILAIESSCDETAAAVVENGITILSQAVASSSAMHETWGGIVPEVAAREQLKSIIPVLMEALKPFAGENPETVPYLPIIEKHIDAIAVTVGPGLIGSLLIGVEAAKALAFATGKPIIPVNHVLAHMYANVVGGTAISFPAISLVVSGGHTELFLMKSPKDLTWLGGTIDDAAGEAFDKTARLLGFGAGGGVAIQNAAGKAPHTSSPIPIRLPRPLLHDNTYNFSFSGLKTAIMRNVGSLKANGQWNDEIVNRFALETQEAITDVLVAKTLRAAQAHNAASILVAGGVAANLRLREKFAAAAGAAISFHCPPVELCTDNAAYIGAYAYFRGKPTDWHTIEAQPNASVEV